MGGRGTSGQGTARGKPPSPGQDSGAAPGCTPRADYSAQGTQGCAPRGSHGHQEAPTHYPLWAGRGRTPQRSQEKRSARYKIHPTSSANTPGCPAMLRAAAPELEAEAMQVTHASGKAFRSGCSWHPRSSHQDLRTWHQTLGNAQVSKEPGLLFQHHKAARPASPACPAPCLPLGSHRRSCAHPVAAMSFA